MLCALHYHRLNASAEKEYSEACVPHGVTKQGCDMKKFFLLYICLERLTIKEVLLSNRTFGILLYLCLYPEELVQTATVRSLPSCQSGTSKSCFLLHGVKCCLETLQPIGLRCSTCWQVVLELGFEPVLSRLLECFDWRLLTAQREEMTRSQGIAERKQSYGFYLG